MLQYEINIENILKIFLIAAIISAAATPVSILIARKIGAVDIPKDDRRMHSVTLPRFGGFAIFLGSMICTGLFIGDNKNIKAAMIGGTLMYILGAIDDIRDLSALKKFFGQLLIAVLMFGMGIKISFITNYFGPGKWMLGDVICFVITVLWIVGITNAINLTDGLDGLAAGVSAIVALCLAYVAYIHGTSLGSAVVCIALTALAGACIGFLPFNSYPAKLFMGDSGALYLGFMIAVLSVISPLKRATVIATMVPVFALAIPIFDTLLAIIRRTSGKQSIMRADKWHLHHRLVASGYDHKRSVMMLYGITGIMGMSAVLMSRELYKDAIFLLIIAATYIYVFATDPAHRDGRRKDNKENKTKSKIRLNKEGEGDE